VGLKTHGRVQLPTPSISDDPFQPLRTLILGARQLHAAMSLQALHATMSLRPASESAARLRVFGPPQSLHSLAGATVRRAELTQGLFGRFARQSLGAPAMRGGELLPD